MAKSGFSVKYNRAVGKFKFNRRKILREAGKLMIEDAIKNIKDQKTPSRRPQKKNTAKTLERKRKKGYGSKSLIERRKSLTKRSGWARDITFTGKGGDVVIRPNLRFLDDDAVDGLLSKGYDFIGISKTGINKVNKMASDSVAKSLRSRKRKTSNFK